MHESPADRVNSAPGQPNRSGATNEAKRRAMVHVGEAFLGLGDGMHKLALNLTRKCRAFAAACCRLGWRSLLRHFQDSGRGKSKRKTLASKPRHISTNQMGADLTAGCCLSSNLQIPVTQPFRFRDFNAAMARHPLQAEKYRASSVVYSTDRIALLAFGG